MKSFNSLYILLVLGVLVSLAGCGSDDSGDAVAGEKEKLALLSHSWTIESVTQQDNRTEEFQDPDFTITFSGSYRSDSPKGPYAYVTEGTQPALKPWATSGTWTFGTDAAKTIVRDDGVNVEYTLENETLTLTFTCATCNEDNGKKGSAEGGWIFVLKAAK